MAASPLRSRATTIGENSNKNAVEQLGEESRDRYVTSQRDRTVTRQDFVSTAVHEKNEIFDLETVVDNFKSWLTGPLEDFKQYHSGRSIIALAAFLMIGQVSVFTLSMVYYYSSVKGNFVSADSGKSGDFFTTCTPITRKTTGTAYADHFGYYPKHATDSVNSHPQAANADIEFIKINLEAYSQTYEQYNSAMANLGAELKTLLRDTQTNTLATNYIYLTTWKTRICSHAIEGNVWEEYTPDNECISVNFDVDVASLFKGVTSVHLYGQDLPNAFACGYSLGNDQQIEQDSLGNSIIKFYVNAYDGTDPGSGIPSFPSVCSNFMTPNQLGLFRMQTNIDQTFEYTLKVHNYDALVVMSINMGIIQMSELHEVPTNIAAAIPSDLKVYVFGRTDQDKIASNIICKVSNYPEGTRPICGLLMNMGAPFGLGFPVMTSGLGYTNLTSPTGTSTQNKFCTCDINKVLYADGVPGSTCSDEFTPEINLIIYKPDPRVITPLMSPENWWLSPFDRFYAALYDSTRNPTGDYKTFSQDIVGLDLQYKAEALTHSFVHYPSNVTLARQLSEEYNLPAQVAGQQFFSFCPDDCVVLQIRTLKSDSAINTDGYTYTNGSCSGLFGPVTAGMTLEEADKWADTTVKNLQSNDLPFQLEQDYSVCKLKTYAAIIRVIPWSMSMMSLFTIVYVGVILSFVTTLLAVFGNDKKRYTVDQMKAASKELAFHLLRARDGDLFGIRECGPLDSLSKDLLRAALYTGGFVDSDDDIEDGDGSEIIRKTIAMKKGASKSVKAQSSRDTFLAHLHAGNTRDSFIDRLSTRDSSAEGLRKRGSTLEVDGAGARVDNPLVQKRSDEENL